jgi:GAF domain-containing protein
MRSPALPANETQRLIALRALDILDTEPEARFDRITRLARRLFSVPIGLVSLVDAGRQWFKSRQGLAAPETPREVSFCGQAVADGAMLVVPDATADQRFSDNPLVVGEPTIRFYAGCPLRVGGDAVIGTLCIIDTQPRALPGQDELLLRDPAAMIEEELGAVREATSDHQPARAGDDRAGRVAAGAPAGRHQLAAAVRSRRLQADQRHPRPCGR